MLFTAAPARAGVSNDDFETGDLTGWSTEFVSGGRLATTGIDPGPGPEPEEPDGWIIYDGEGCNQQFRVDILRPGAEPFSMHPDDILRNVFPTKKDARNVRAPFRVTANLSRFAGRSVMLRFAEVETSTTSWSAWTRSNSSAAAPVAISTTLGPAARSSSGRAPCSR